jgi:pilus assembly protein CpaB
MRATTVISLVLALILAGLAVLGLKSWMAAQREAITQMAQQSTAQAPKNVVVVAKVPMGFGDRLTAERVELLEWASDKLPAGAFTKIEDVVGSTEESARYALGSISPGEMILPGQITDPGQRAKLSTAISPGMKAVSIRVNDVLGVAGFVLPGDRVDVMLTRAEDGRPFVDILLTDVRVVAIDQTTDDRKDQPSVVKTVTFEVTTEDAQKLTLGATVGTLSLALRNVAAPTDEKIDRVTMIDLNESESVRRAQQLAEENARREAEFAAENEKRAAELAATQAALEQARAQQDNASAEALARMAALEKELDDLRAAQADALKTMESKPQPAEPAPVAEPAPSSNFVNIGVVRGGRRDEYRVQDLFGLGN